MTREVNVAWAGGGFDLGVPGVRITTEPGRFSFWRGQIPGRLVLTAPNDAVAELTLRTEKGEIACASDTEASEVDATTTAYPLLGKPGPGWTLTATVDLGPEYS